MSGYDYDKVQPETGLSQRQIDQDIELMLDQLDEKPEGTWGHVQGMGEVFIPEKQFLHCPEDHYVRLVHGSRYTIAVFTANHECVGWVVKE